jgi:NAD(P)-dependent dehydrogenase (short-subunit alcohol dehydrogenase family)
MRALQIDQEAINDFLTKSGDTNKIHSVARYAAHTPFGRCVVPGMLLVSECLRSRDLNATGQLRLEVLFRDPVLVGDRIACRESRTTKGAIVSRLAYPTGPSVADIEVLQPAPSLGLSSPNQNRFLYESGWNAHLQPALGWVSWLAGTKMSARGLLLRVHLDLAPEYFQKPRGKFWYSAEQPVRGKIEAAIWPHEDAHTPLGKATIHFLELPEEVSYSLEDLKAEVEQVCSPRCLHGRTALVTGGSHGLGSLMVAALAQVGAETLWTERPGSAIDPNLIPDLPAGSEPILVEDLGAWGSLDAVPSVDLLILCAWPPARRITGAEWTWAGAEMNIRLLDQMMPKMIGQKTIVVVSSSFVEDPDPRYAQYAAEKAAVEAYAKAARKRFEGIDLVIVRPGPFLSGRTNMVPLPDPPYKVTADILKRL